jgi:hypothetical protein
LLIDMQAKPIALGDGAWGFELELDIYNRLATGVFDLGPEPLVIFTIAVTLPDGSGFGSGGGCAFGTSMHGSKAQAFGPGERRSFLERWMAGVETAQTLEAGIRLCHVQLPDGRSLSGEFARIDVTIDGEGKLARFELHPVAVPQPQSN